VSQVAGKLQGLETGGLGDLGEASLSARHINQLLDATMTCNLKQDKPSIQVSEFERVHLELTAKLLACAQWRYIGSKEWNESGNPTESLITMVQDDVHIEDYLRISEIPTAQKTPNLGASTIMEHSPFVSHVLRPLYDNALPDGMVGLGADCKPVSKESRQDPDLKTVLEGQPLLKALSSNTTATATNVAALAPLLQTLSAAAETFPGGCCWTSSCLPSHWRRLPVVKEWKMRPLWSLVCSPDDLATVVLAVACVLFSHGGASGNENVQRWALLCLQKLTYSTAVQTLLGDSATESFDSIKASWRLVWSVLFKADLRYNGVTKDPTSGSVGDLVVQLLKAMVQQFCTDPGVQLSSPTQLRQSTFIYTQQGDVWNLPVFWNPLLPDTASCFGLIQALLFGVGLSESGTDMICQAIPSDQCLSPPGVNLKRRCKLLNFCLQNLRSVSHESTVAGK